MERRRRDIIVKGIPCVVQQLFPSDFLGEDTWPFRYYFVKGEEISADEWSWKGGIKPKWVLEAEARVRKTLSLGILYPKLRANDLVSLCHDEKMIDVRNELFAQIFVTSYGLDDAKTRQLDCGLSRTHLIEIGYKAREFCKEPWEIMFGNTGEPEGYNPRRHDFNTIALKTMLEHDAEMARRANNG